jgi:heterodisulfide reductase subunit C
MIPCTGLMRVRICMLGLQTGERTRRPDSHKIADENAIWIYVYVYVCMNLKFKICTFASECCCVYVSLSKLEVFDGFYCEIRYFESAFLRRVTHDGSVKFTDWIPTTGLTMHAMEKLLLGMDPETQTLHESYLQHEISNSIDPTLCTLYT